MARKPYVTVRAANVWNKGEIRIARGTLAITLISGDGSQHQVGISLSEIVNLPLYKEIRKEGVVVRHVKFLFKLRPPLEVLFFQKNVGLETHSVAVRWSDFCVRAAVLG